MIDPIRSVGIAAITLAVVAALLIGGWIGGELHYRNCLQSVELRYPVAYQPGQGNGDNPWSTYREQFGIGPHAHFVFYENAQRDRAISGCSRWP